MWEECCKDDPTLDGVIGYRVVIEVSVLNSDGNEIAGDLIL